MPKSIPKSVPLPVAMDIWKSSAGHKRFRALAVAITHIKSGPDL
jgi:putative effector of murein hydrolase